MATHLRWNDVSNPNFSGVNDATRLMGDFLNRGFSTLDSALEGIERDNTKRNSTLLQQRALSYTSPEQLNAALADGSIYNGLNRDTIGSDALDFAAKRNGTMLTNAGTAITNAQLGYDLQRGQVLDGRGDATWNAKQQAEPIAARMRQMALDGDEAGARSLYESNADLFGRAGLGADFLTANNAAIGTGQQTRLNSNSYDESMRSFDNLTTSRDIVDQAFRSFGTKEDALRALPGLRQRGVSPEVIDQSLKAIGESNSWGQPSQLDQIGQSLGVAPVRQNSDTSWYNQLINSESGGNFEAHNSEGYVGRGQFGDARLQDAKNAGVIPASMTKEQFKKDKNAQLATEAWHFNDIDQQANRLGVDRFIGQVIGGVEITPNAIRQMAHLGGIGGVKRFVESGGRYNPSDSNGTSLVDYGLKANRSTGGSGTPLSFGSNVPRASQNIGMDLGFQAMEETARAAAAEQGTRTPEQDAVAASATLARTAMERAQNTSTQPLASAPSDVARPETNAASEALARRAIEASEGRQGAPINPEASPPPAADQGAKDPGFQEAINSQYRARLPAITEDMTPYQRMQAEDARNNQVDRWQQGLSEQAYAGGTNDRTSNPIVGAAQRALGFFTDTPAQAAEAEASRVRSRNAGEFYDSSQARRLMETMPAEVYAAQQDPVGYAQGVNPANPLLPPEAAFQAPAPVAAPSGSNAQAQTAAAAQTAMAAATGAPAAAVANVPATSAGVQESLWSLRATNNADEVRNPNAATTEYLRMNAEDTMSMADAVKNVREFYGEDNDGADDAVRFVKEMRGRGLSAALAHQLAIDNVSTDTKLWGMLGSGKLKIDRTRAEEVANTLMSGNGTITRDNVANQMTDNRKIRFNEQLTNITTQFEAAKTAIQEAKIQAAGNPQRLADIERQEQAIMARLQMNLQALRATEDATLRTRTMTDN